MRKKNKWMMLVSIILILLLAFGGLAIGEDNTSDTSVGAVQPTYNIVQYKSDDGQHYIVDVYLQNMLCYSASFGLWFNPAYLDLAVNTGDEVADDLTSGSYRIRPYEDSNGNQLACDLFVPTMQSSSSHEIWQYEVQSSSAYHTFSWISYDGQNGEPGGVDAFQAVTNGEPNGYLIARYTFQIKEGAPSDLTIAVSLMDYTLTRLGGNPGYSELNKEIWRAVPPSSGGGEAGGGETGGGETGGGETGGGETGGEAGGEETGGEETGGEEVIALQEENTNDVTADNEAEPTEPTEPSTEPTEPGTEPTDPEPTDPEPTDPEPTEPEDNATGYYQGFGKVDKVNGSMEQMDIHVKGLAAQDGLMVAFPITSYDPKKTLTISLYEATDHTTAVRTETFQSDTGTGKVIGSYTLVNVTPGVYYVEISKPGHIPVIYDTLTLSAEQASAPNTLLIPGDINGDEKTKLSDRTLLLGFMHHNRREPNVTPGDESSEAAHEKYVREYNNADIDGDGKVDMQDLNILMHKDYYNKVKEVVRQTN